MARLDLDAHYNWCKRDTRTGPSLGYSVSRKGASTRCFRGSERLVSNVLLLFPVLSCSSRW